MTTSLKQKTISGVQWQVIGKVSQKVLSVGTFAVLARLLEPSVFGLFAMAFIAIDALSIFKAFGFDSALVQRKDNVEDAAHTAFFLTLGTGLVMFGICFMTAPFAAAFFANPKLLNIVRALGAVFILSTLSKVPASLLRKRMRFKIVTIVEFISAVVNSAVAIGTALVWKNVWCLVWAYLAKQITMAVLFWYFSSYRFRWRFDPVIAKELFAFGKFMVGVGVLWFVSANMATAVVGKIMGAVMLGYFALARNITNFINTHFTQLLASVLFPAYATIQHDRSDLKRVYLKSIRFVSMFSVPFCVAVICTANEFVLTLYGEKWLPIVPLIQLLGVTQFTIPLMHCTGPLFTGCGKPEYSYRLALLDIVIRLPLIVVFTQKWGLIGTICSGFITLVINVPLKVYFAKRMTGFRMSELFQQIAAPIYSAIGMLAVMSGLKMISCIYPFLTAFHGYYVVHLIVLAVTGIGTYIGLFHMFDRPTSLEARKMIFRFERA